MYAAGNIFFRQIRFQDPFWICLGNIVLCIVWYSYIRSFLKYFFYEIHYC